MTNLLELFKPGQRIFVAGSSNEPTALLAHLQDQALPEQLEFVQFPIGGYNEVDFTAWNDTARLTTFFMTSALRKADPARLNFLPMQMRAVYDYLAQDIDVCLVQVAFDRDGVLRLGPNVDFIDAVLANRPVIVAELNRHITAPLGSPQIPLERLNYVFDSERELFAMPPSSIKPPCMPRSFLAVSCDNIAAGIAPIPV